MNLLEDQDHILQLGQPENQLKPVIVHTYATQTLTPTNFTPSSFSSLAKSWKTLKTSVDISLQEEIFKGNAGLLKSAVAEYFKQSLGQKLDEVRGTFHRNIFNPNYEMEQEEQESIIELIVSKNNLLSFETQLKLFNQVNQFPQLSSLFEQLKPLLGAQITQQFSFIMFQILTLKLESFKKLQESEVLELIPHIQRFWGDQNRIELLQNGWEVYQDIDYAKIKGFAVEKIEEMAYKLYYAPQLRILNLSQLQVSNNYVSAKFAALLCFFAENIFLTISEMRQQKQDLQEFLQELRMQISSERAQLEYPTKHTKLE